MLKLYIFCLNTDAFSIARHLPLTAMNNMSLLSDTGVRDIAHSSKLCYECGSREMFRMISGKRRNPIKRNMMTVWANESCELCRLLRRVLLHDATPEDSGAPWKEHLENEFKLYRRVSAAPFDVSRKLAMKSYQMEVHSLSKRNHRSRGQHVWKRLVDIKTDFLESEETPKNGHINTREPIPPLFQCDNLIAWLGECENDHILAYDHQQVDDLQRLAESGRFRLIDVHTGVVQHFTSVPRF